MLVRKNAQKEKLISIRVARRIIKGDLRRQEKRRKSRAAAAWAGMRAPNNNARERAEGYVHPKAGSKDLNGGGENTGDSSAHDVVQGTARMNELEGMEEEEEKTRTLVAHPSAEESARGCARDSLHDIYRKVFNLKQCKIKMNFNSNMQVNLNFNSDSNSTSRLHPKSRTFSSESGDDDMDVGTTEKPGDPKQRNGTFVGTLFEGLDRSSKMIRSTTDRISSFVDCYLWRPTGPSCSKRRPPSSTGSLGSKKRSLISGLSVRLMPDTKLYRPTREPRFTKFSVALASLIHSTYCKSELTHIHNLGLRSDHNGAEPDTDTAPTCGISSSGELRFPPFSDATITRPIPLPPVLGSRGCRG